MTTFSERLQAVIGDEAPTPWAQARGLSGATIHEWLSKEGVVPQPKTLSRLEGSTGIPKGWWLNGDLPPPVPDPDLLAGASAQHKPNRFIVAMETNRKAEAERTLRNEAAHSAAALHDHQPYGEVDPLLLEKVVGQMLRYLEENKDRVRIDAERQAALIAILYRWAAKSGGISDEEFLQLMRAAA